MLTRQESRVLRFIREYLQRHQCAPSLDEIARAIGINSRGTAHRYVTALERKGYLEREPHNARAMRLTDESTAAVMPLLGRIAAGRPIEAIADQDELDLGRLFAGPDRFVLEVRGDSMIGAGILDGDMVILQRQVTASDGDIVVALIDDEEATLKRFRSLDGGRIALEPANTALETMIYPAGRVAVQGVLVGQLRKYR